MPHEVPEGSNLFLEGVSVWARFWAIFGWMGVLSAGRAFSIPADSLTDKRERSRSRNRGLRFGIRVHNGRFQV